MIKRGQLVLKALIVLVISAAIIILYPYIGAQFGSRDVYKREIAAREIALIIDTLYAYPYDVTISYEKDLTGLSLEISDNKIKIYGARFNNYLLDPSNRKYDFIPTGAIKTKLKLENPEKIKFEKLNGELSVNEIKEQ